MALITVFLMLMKMITVKIWYKQKHCAHVLLLPLTAS